MSKLHALTALIEGRTAQILANEDRPRLGQIKAREGAVNLLEQLRSNAKLPDVDIDVFSGLLDIQGLVSERNPLTKLRDFFLDRLNAIERIVEADSPEEVLTVTRTLLREQLQDLRDTALPFLGRQFGIALSLLITLRNLPKAGPAIKTALLSYFFTKEGFTTIDGLQLVASADLGGIDLKQLGQVKALLSERTADRYIRDTIRLIVEAAGDVRYEELRKRYDAMLTHMATDEKKEKFADWFKGFSAMAESTVMGAVEEATLGVAAFQTNPLIAASASTFAGVAARKAAQHVFLSELESLLR